jgi:hypothetical protein
VPLVAVLVLLAAIAIVVLGLVGARLGDRARARTAADAVALAGAASGRDAADQVAAANRAVVVEWHPDGDGVTVVVQVGDATARARAVRACARSAESHLVDSGRCLPSNPG